MKGAAARRMAEEAAPALVSGNIDVGCAVPSNVRGSRSLAILPAKRRNSSERGAQSAGENPETPPRADDEDKKLSFGEWLRNHFEKYEKGGAFIPDEKYRRCVTIAKSWHENPQLNKKGAPGQKGTAKERAWIKERGWTYRLPEPESTESDGTCNEGEGGLWAPPEEENGPNRMVIPASRVQQVIEETHLAIGHLKRDKCWAQVRRSDYPI